MSEGISNTEIALRNEIATFDLQFGDGTDDMVHDVLLFSTLHALRIQFFCNDT